MDHPIEEIMNLSMNSIKNMIDVNTIVGDMVSSPDGTVIIPVSKVCFGFAAGGSEFNTNKLNKYSENTKLPFGGGSGAGVHISPVAFLTVKDGQVKLLNINGTTSVDKLIDLVPDVVNKANDLVQKMVQKPKQVLKIEQNETSSDPDDIEDWHKV